ncbi:phage baseplate plug family protein [Achromobacter sp. ESBL13]|uniref:phage baseplate plug family protein n=1 Tax=Achromobacter sp. ESBL13 TaxID=3077328 RepID=UPI002FCA5E5C
MSLLEELETETGDIDLFRELGDTDLILGQRIIAEYPILPYRYLSQQGNFAILTRDGELPWWEEFGRSQSMIYLEPAEVGIDD